MRLFSRLQKLAETGGEWRILSLEAGYVRDRLVASCPSVEAGLPVSLTDEARGYPRGYRHLALVMLNRGLEPRKDLPNEDVPESIRRIVDGNRRFLDGAEMEMVG